MLQAVERHEAISNLIRDISGCCRTISFIGFEKGSGKTTALKAFLAALSLKTIGLTSMGTAAGSPNTKAAVNPVYVPAGTIVATARTFFGMCDTTSEILEATGIQTPMGEVILFRARSAGYVFLAGPSMIADSIKVRDMFFEAGADLVLIDSAIDRKSAAYPAHTDGVVITGGVSGTSAGVFDDRLSREIESLLTPVVEDPLLLEAIQNHMDDGVSFFLLDENMHLWFTEEGDSRTGMAALLEKCPNRVKAFVIKGALTNSNILSLLSLSSQASQKVQGAVIAGEDPARIFVDIKHQRSLENSGIHLRVIKAVRVLALCLNPSRPGINQTQRMSLLRGYHDRFGLPVLDVVGGLYVEGI